MIPKIIHYCWFGRGQMPPLALNCIDSWKRYLPDYELRLWNEDTFDLDVELREEFFSPNPGKQMPFIKPLYDRLVSLTGIKPNIHIQPPGTIQRSTGKAKHVNDKRDFSNWH